jgi:hypothetical protein
MHPNISSKNVRLNVQIPLELKDKLNWAAAIKGKKMSVLVRESIEQELRAGKEIIWNFIFVISLGKVYNSMTDLLHDILYLTSLNHLLTP